MSHLNELHTWVPACSKCSVISSILGTHGKLAAMGIYSSLSFSGLSFCLVHTRVFAHTHEPRTIKRGVDSEPLCPFVETAVCVCFTVGERYCCITHLQQPQDVLTIDFESFTRRTALLQQHVQLTLAVKSSGKCHGLVLWIEYHCGSSSDGDGVLWSSGPHHAGPSLQGLRLCQHSRLVQVGQELTIEGCLDIAKGSLSAAIL